MIRISERGVVGAMDKRFYQFSAQVAWYCLLLASSLPLIAPKQQTSVQISQSSLPSNHVEGYGSAGVKLVEYGGIISARFAAFTTNR